MKKAVLLGLLTSSFLFSDDYLPLSELSKDKQYEYNFITLGNTVIDAKEVNTQSTPIPDGYKSVDKIVQEVPKEENTIIVEEVKKTNEIKLPKQNDLILKDEVKLTPNKEVELQRDVFFSAQLTFSPITTDLSGSGMSLSSKSNTIIPEIKLDIKDSSIVAEYFTSEDKFSGVNTGVINTKLQWFKLGYRYNIDDLSIGADMNYVTLDVNETEDYNELYPSLELEFNHDIENIELSYGAGYGKNNNIDYSYDYFLSAGIKPYALSEASLVAGYKNRTIKDSDTKLEFSGPFIGVNSTF